MRFFFSTVQVLFEQKFTVIYIYSIFWEDWLDGITFSKKTESRNWLVSINLKKKRFFFIGLFNIMLVVNYFFFYFSVRDPIFFSLQLQQNSFDGYFQGYKQSMNTLNTSETVSFVMCHFLQHFFVLSFSQNYLNLLYGYSGIWVSLFKILFFLTFACEFITIDMFALVYFYSNIHQYR